MYVSAPLFNNDCICFASTFAFELGTISTKKSHVKTIFIYTDVFNYQGGSSLNFNGFSSSLETPFAKREITSNNAS